MLENVVHEDGVSHEEGVSATMVAVSVACRNMNPTWEGVGELHILRELEVS